LKRTLAHAELMIKFHQSKEWLSLSKQHKAIERAYSRWKCVDCGNKGEDLQSDHVLCVKHYPMFKLWLCNLKLRCGPCNIKKGTKFYVSPRSLLLVGYYYMIRFLKTLVLVVWLVFSGHLLWLDLAFHPFHSTFSYQILSGYEETFHDLMRYFQSYQVQDSYDE